MARQAKINDDSVVDSLVEAAELGLKRDLMADFAGIGRSTLFGFWPPGRRRREVGLERSDCASRRPRPRELRPYFRTSGPQPRTASGRERPGSSNVGSAIAPATPSPMR